MTPPLSTLLPTRAQNFRTALAVLQRTVARFVSTSTHRFEAEKVLAQFELVLATPGDTQQLLMARAYARAYKRDRTGTSEKVYGLACAMEALATYGTATDASAAATALANVAEFAGYADASDVDYDALEATAEKNALASC